MEARKLEPIIKNLLKFNKFEFEIEDLYQELFLKGLEVLSSEKVKSLNEREKWKYVKTSLHNHLKDLKKKLNLKILHFSDIENERGEIDFILTPYMNVGDTHHVKFIDPEKYVILKDLIEKVKRWGLNHEDESVRLFFSEYFNPSKEVINYMEKQSSKGTWKNRKFEPLFLAKALTEIGKWNYKDPRDKWLKIRKRIVKDLGLAF